MHQTLISRHRKPICLDLYCGAGGSASGYHQAGFDVVGVDILPQPRYPFPFILGDALLILDQLLLNDKLPFSNGASYDISDIAFIHASPPCQPYTLMYRGLLQSIGAAKEYPKLIEPTRMALVATGLPYIIENVPGSPLINPVMLCGSSFGLPIRRHRFFESNKLLFSLPCMHRLQTFDKPPLHRLVGHSRVVGVYGNSRGKGDNLSARRHAMQIDWMTHKELTQAVPPIYTHFLGKQMIQYC
jgi:DNA (cytosine-5)-methyltransferase 1